MYKVQYYDIKRGYHSETLEVFHKVFAESIARKLESRADLFSNIEVVGARPYISYEGPYKAGFHPLCPTDSRFFSSLA